MTRRCGRLAQILIRVLLGVGVVMSCAVIAGASTITVAPGGSIQTAIDGAAPGDTIQLGAGTYDVASTILVNKAVTISGPTVGTATVRGTTAGALSVFWISQSGATIRGLDITWASLLEATYASLEILDSLVRVDGSGLSAVVIQNNTVYVPAQAGAMGTWVARAITVDDGACTGVTITGNTVYNTRNGIVVRSNDTATITNNVIYNTKGGIMNYTSNQADANNRTMTGNSWGTTHNEWDIVWNTFAYFVPDYQQSVIGLSSLNNGAYVVDRRAQDATACANLTGNRSHIFVSAGSAFTTTTGNPAKGNSNEPFSKMSLGVDSVTSGGTIYVAPGTYAGNVIVYKDGVTLKSTGGPGATTVDASLVDKSGYKNQWGKGISYSWAETYDPGLLKNGFLVWSDNVTIDGFRIVNAYYPAQYNRGIAVLIGSIHSTYAGFIPWNIDQWGGIVWPYDEPTPTGVTIRNMVIDGPSDGIYVWSSSGNTIELNTIRNTFPLGGTGIQVYEGGTDNLIQKNVVDNAVDGVSICGAWPNVYLDVGGTKVLYNDLTNNRGAGIKFYNVADPNGKSVVALYNVISGNANGIVVDGGHASVPVAHYNSITSNTGFGASNNDTTGNFDASLNWWGSATGPANVANPGGTGDRVSGYVIFSPWLGIAPDADPTTPGVQLVSGMVIIVASAGPAPAGGYMNVALDAANGLAGTDLILVQPGSYAATSAITDGVQITSTGGAANTTLGGNIALNVANILLGWFAEGFTIAGDITVGIGVDASTSHINWNNLQGIVTNNGLGSLDATYNYWGVLNPATKTVGLVLWVPFLPMDVDTIIGYMVEHGLDADAAIAYATFLLNEPGMRDPALALAVANQYGISLEEAATLIREYGSYKVFWAMRLSQDLEGFTRQLLGYAMNGGGAGGGVLDQGIAGGGGSINGVELEASYTVGEPIHIAFSLTDPITGGIVSNAIATLSVVRVNTGDVTEFISWDMIPYDAVSGQYMLTYATAALVPGTYDLFIGTNDGQQKQMRIQITAP